MLFLSFVFIFFVSLPFHYISFLSVHQFGKGGKLQKELLKLANSKKDYNSVADEIDRLRELKQNALVESAEREGLKQRIREMREFLEQQATEVTEYDELLVRRLIEKVTVYDERFEVEFKSGTKVDVVR